MVCEPEARGGNELSQKRDGPAMASRVGVRIGSPTMDHGAHARAQYEFLGSSMKTLKAGGGGVRAAVEWVSRCECRSECLLGRLVRPGHTSRVDSNGCGEATLSPSTLNIATPYHMNMPMVSNFCNVFFGTTLYMAWAMYLVPSRSLSIYLVSSPPKI